MTVQELDKILLHNVVRVEFIKRTNGEERDMLCTKCLAVLASPEGRLKLKWYPPKGKAAYTPFDYNLTIVWDIRKMDYRQVCADNMKVLDVVGAEQYLRLLKGMV